jgi:hypothetical protein
MLIVDRGVCFATDQGKNVYSLTLMSKGECWQIFNRQSNGQIFNRQNECLSLMASTTVKMA